MRSRSPHGERGLKCKADRCTRYKNTSLPPRGAGEDMNVYVALDNRVETLPAWLNGWEKTTMTAQTDP